jgi:lysophospholipase L1-like esterase
MIKIKGKIKGISNDSWCYIYQWTDEKIASVLPTGKFEFDFPDSVVKKDWTSLEVHLPDGRKIYTPAFHSSKSPVFQLNGDEIVLIGYEGELPDKPTPIFKEQKRILLFGDSDSSPKGETLAWRSSDVTTYLNGDIDLSKALNCNKLVTTNCAQGATPVYPAHMDHDGVTQVREALERIPDIDVAICRYGLNDCHAYMQTPTSENRAKFNKAYSECIDMLKARNITVVLVKIQLEQRQDRRAGILAANAELEKLAKTHQVLLVDPSIEWENDKNIFHTDGIHLKDEGQKRVAMAVKEGLIKFNIPIIISPPVDPGELNIKDVKFTYDELDIGSWAETAVLRGVKITGTEGDGSGMIKFDWDIPDWPAIKMFGDGALTIGNPVVIVKKDGKWIGASFTWLRPGQKEKGRHEIDDPTIKQGPLMGWRPQKGETVYFMIAGLCREKQRNVNERTNIIKYIF